MSRSNVSKQTWQVCRSELGVLWMGDGATLLRVDVEEVVLG